MTSPEHFSSGSPDNSGDFDISGLVEPTPETREQLEAAIQSLKALAIPETLKPDHKNTKGSSFNRYNKSAYII